MTELAAPAARSRLPGWHASRWAWMLVVLFFVGASLGHLEFTLWLIKPRQVFGVRFAFKDYFAAFALLGGLSLFVYVTSIAMMKKMETAARRAWLAGWGLWATCAWLADRYLTYSVYEYAHYPQYALLALLLGRAMDPLRRRGCGPCLIAAATLLGIGDELIQYLWVTPTYGHYLDFNDFLVNMLGASAGALLYYSREPVEKWGAPEHAAHCCTAPLARWVVAVLCAALVIALTSGLVRVSPDVGEQIPPGGWLRGAEGVRFYLQRRDGWYGSWQTGPYRGRYFVLPPGAGLGLLIGLGVLLARWSGTVARHRRTRVEPDASGSFQEKASGS